MSGTEDIQMVRLEIADEKACEQLSQQRSLLEYDPASINDRYFLLPPTVDRFLFSLEAMKDLQETVRVHQIEDAHIRIIKQRLLCLTTQGPKLCFVPLHVTTSFRYHEIRISGRYFVSLLHRVSDVLPESLWKAPWAAGLREMRQPLSPQQRQALLEYYMQSYLTGASSCTDLTVIAIPGKSAELREQSPTHRAFSSLAIPFSNKNECAISLGNSDLYIFAHGEKEGGKKDATRLFTEPAILDTLLSFMWSSAVFEKQRTVYEANNKTSQFQEIYQRLLYTSLEWLRVTWEQKGGQGY